MRKWGFRLLVAGIAGAGVALLVVGVVGFMSASSARDDQHEYAGEQ